MKSAVIKTDVNTIRSEHRKREEAIISVNPIDASTANADEDNSNTSDPMSDIQGKVRSKKVINKSWKDKKQTRFSKLELKMTYNYMEVKELEDKINKLVNAREERSPHPETWNKEDGDKNDFMRNTAHKLSTHENSSEPELANIINHVM